MKEDSDLVASLVDRLATRLPHRTSAASNVGSSIPLDETLSITRATLVELASAAPVPRVFEALTGLLEDLAGPYTAASTHPRHVFLSVAYVTRLTADCCNASWERARRKPSVHANDDSDSEVDRAEEEGDEPELDWRVKTPPARLAKDLVTRIFDVVKTLLEPIPDNHSTPMQSLLDQIYDEETAFARVTTLSDSGSKSSAKQVDTAAVAEEMTELLAHAKTIIEYVTASNWTASFEYTRNVMYLVRVAGATMNQGSDPNVSTVSTEREALVVLRMTSFFWVNSQKLGLLIQEICSGYLHFTRESQSALAIVTPLLIIRWIDRYPHQFIQLHLHRRRLDGGADTLFDMTTQSVPDNNNRRRTLLFPLQTMLLLLLPDVFEVASNLREAKSVSVTKKVTFLDALRKTMRNGNEQAAYCLVSLLRSARHFELDSDSALVSYAMDVQDEVCDAIFQPLRNTIHAPGFQQSLVTAAFVSLVRLNVDRSTILVDQCTAPGAKATYKIALVQACRYFAVQKDAEVYKGLIRSAVPFMRSQLEAQSASSKVAKAPDNAGLVCSILEFLHAAPNYLLEDLSSDDASPSFFKPFLFCILSSDTSKRKLAAQVAKRVFKRNETDSRTTEAARLLSTKELRTELWSRSSKILVGLCERITHSDDPDLSMLHDYFEARLLLLKSIPALADVPNDVQDVVMASSRLETMLLVSLCSADMETCQLVTSCITQFVEESAIVDQHAESAKPTSSVLRNGNIFRELACKEFRFTGLVAFQKRARSLLRRMQFPTPAILNAWEIAFERWIHLVKDVSAPNISDVDDRVLSEWRNYSGFLASLGGICTADQAVILEEPALGGLRWIDRISSDQYEEPLLTRYLRLSIQLLACANVRVRETMRDVLSSEVSPVLYHALFKALDSELDLLFNGALAPADKGQNREVVFAEQSASLLRALVERLESPSDLAAASSVHLGALTLSFAKFLDGFPDTPNSLRVRIRVCHLCEAITARKEHLNLRDDVRIRNQLFEVIFGWMTRPKSSQAENTQVAPRMDESSRVQRDLDRACLKSLAGLTFRLPLQPSDTQTDAGMSEMKSQMFHTYFSRFLLLLNREPLEKSRPEHSSKDDQLSNSDLAITVLSNLLSANIDVGLKHSLNIGYHDNVEIRTAFVKVLYNILIQGTEFSNLTDSAVSEKYEELLEILTSDLSLALSMASICPSSEVDEITMCFLTVFEQRGQIFELLEALIKQEIEDTVNETEILRRTSVATKMLSIYAKWKGASYLRGTLQKVLERLVLTSQDLDLELDPARVTSQEELQKNALQLQIVTKVFIDDICASTAEIPSSFMRICSIISDAVQIRFPDAKYTAVGAFIFLRFFCPAIVAPETEGLVTMTPSKEMRRGLLLIAKVIQNLANNVLFGAKEPYMFPLNHFLTQNIYLVTTFLREISVPPDPVEVSRGMVTSEGFDFGSCVALHRFLYDHWDHIRQTLVSRERREFVRSPGDLSRARSPVLEPLRDLIVKLGPPPLAVSWNRPGTSTNSPPMYSRFQNFMLRNAFKSTESFLTERAVYDGGESKDGLSIICVILRHIETESIDYDTLLFCYLKIASRLWHQPFGILIDATCYNARNEPDELSKALELLTPSELSKNLQRIYVYNMNSAFKRTFRRSLRAGTKYEDSIFNCGKVECHLIGSLQDLQNHFHLSQLVLPKETIGVVTDTRYMFQPVTRLSKSKGKIDVSIKVGHQFVQITTNKKQDIHAGMHLNATINDIFKLSEVDETSTSNQAEDESAFGLRADAGRIVMHFTSPKKAEILQTIRTAKMKYGKDPRMQKTVERLIRPQDVPGTLLNLALSNMSSCDHALRLSSFNLLGALCRAFKFGAGAGLICIKELFVPSNPVGFILNASRELARTEPQLTLDFLTEFFVGWDSFTDQQKSLNIAYIVPWIPGLRTDVLQNETEPERGRERVAMILGKLIDIAVSEQSLCYMLQRTAWSAVAKDEVLVDILLEELMKTATTIEPYDNDALDLTTSIITGLGSVTIRGKILARLRKALNRSSLRPSRNLPDNAVWPEVCILLRFAQALSFNCPGQSQLFLPEVFHVVTMIANIGSQHVRNNVYKLLINTVHSLCAGVEVDEHKLGRLKANLELLCEPRGDMFSSLAFPRDGGPSSSTAALDSGSSLAATENLAAALFEVCVIAAPSVDMGNRWRSRWMSLVASTAFQNNPALQPRAFTVMGYLAREEVDDDLLYQILVALRNSIGHFGDDNGNEMLMSIITSLSRMMNKLPPASRYGLQLFWLAVSLVRLLPTNLFNCAAHFLEAVLKNICAVGDVRGESMVPLLLQGRSQLDEIMVPLDEVYGIHFSTANFHHAVCACLARGLTDTITRSTALRVLSAFLETTTMSLDPINDLSSSMRSSPYFGLILARAVGLDELKDSLWLAGLGLDENSDLVLSRSKQDITGLTDNELIAMCAIELVDFEYLEDVVQARSLIWLHKLVKIRPSVAGQLRGAIQPRVADVLLRGQNPITLQAAHEFLQAVLSHPFFSESDETNPGLAALNAILDSVGLEGLWRSCSLKSMEDVNRQCLELTGKLIEIIII